MYVPHSSTVSVGLAQARPNYCMAMYMFIRAHVQIYNYIGGIKRYSTYYISACICARSNIALQLLRVPGKELYSIGGNLVAYKFSDFENCSDNNYW